MNKEFKEQIIFRLEENLPRVEKCLQLLSEDQVWHKPNESLNSIGNLILHVCGNVRQYAISSLTNKPDLRERSLEFTETKTLNKKELWEMFSSTLFNAKAAINTVDDGELNRQRIVQGFELTGIGILIHVTEHLSYHVGQISLLTKLYLNQDLGYYSGQDLNVKNEDN